MTLESSLCKREEREWKCEMTQFLSFCKEQAPVLSDISLIPTFLQRIEFS